METPEPDAVKVDKPVDGITVITIDREKRKNAVDNHTAAKLYQAFLAFEDDEAQRVCVFHGAHGTFCAGADLHAVARSAGLANSKPPFSKVDGLNIAPMGPSRLQVKKPVIAAVSGYAVAGGLELSLLADMRVVEEDAVFGVFCRRWGVPLIDGGTVRLQSVVGLGRAMDMILVGKAMLHLVHLLTNTPPGRPVGAQEALAMGLANRVVPNGKAFEEALNLAKQLLRFPYACMQADRASCYYSAYAATSLEDALSYEFDHGIEIVQAEGIQGAARFSSGAGRGGNFERL